MNENKASVRDAATCLAAGEAAAIQARRVTRWFKVFAWLHAGAAFAFTLAVDVFEAPFWPAAGSLVVFFSMLWGVALRNRVAAPRYGMRNVGIAFATWFVVYFVMLDPALQLFGAVSSAWWVGAGIIAASPFAACAFPSSRQ